MIVTTSNVLLNTTPTVTTGVSTDLPKNITNPDFSAVYVSSNNQSLVAEFGGMPTINYVAVAGLDIAGDNSGSSYVRVLNNSTVISTINVTDKQVVVLSFTPQTFSNLKIELYNGAANRSPMVSFVAAGTAFTVPNGGENSGYNRQFLARNQVNQTTVSNQAQPIAHLKKKKQAKGSLRLPNMTKAFSETTWQTFLDFSLENYFFIKEQEDVVVDVNSGTNKSAYLCYDVANNSVMAHGQTRALNNIAISFKVMNGL